MYFTFLVNIKIWCKIQVIIFPLFAFIKGKNKKELQSEALIYHKIGPDYYNIGGFIGAKYSDFNGFQIVSFSSKFDGLIRNGFGLPYMKIRTTTSIVDKKNYV